jgi:hypothetical protein
MNASLVIESAENEAALELSPYDANFFLATLRSRGVNGTAKVGTYMSNGVADFFADFARHWKGWEGSKEWRSLEGELSLTARSDTLGHVYLTSTLREGAPDKWTLRANLVLEAGRLSDLASRAEGFEKAVFRAA